MLILISIFFLYRGIEDELEGTETSDDLSVDPELEGQIDTVMRVKHCPVNTE
jgi:hypothetical protein